MFAKHDGTTDDQRSVVRRQSPAGAGSYDALPRFLSLLSPAGAGSYEALSFFPTRSVSKRFSSRFLRTSSAPKICPFIAM